MTSKLNSRPSVTSPVTLVLGVLVDDLTSDRAQNLRACLRALDQQTLTRRAYRIVLVEQGVTPRLESPYGGLVDEYVFAYSSKPFNRSWILNIGAHRISQGVICTFDADLLVPPEFLQRGLFAWQCGALAIKPYTHVLYMNDVSTARAHGTIAAGGNLHIDSPLYQGDLHPYSKGGCIWVDAALYRRMGGHDERFEGWGLEDREFWDRLQTYTTVVTLNGRVLHMYHERSVEKRPEVFESAVLYRGLQDRFLPPQRGPVGDPDRFREWRSIDGHQSAPQFPDVVEARPHHRHVTRERLQQDIFEEAERVVRDPDDPTDAVILARRLRLRGVLAADGGNPEAAIVALSSVVKLFPNSSSILCLLCLALVRAQRLDDAVTAGLAALRLAPMTVGPYRVSALALRRLGHLNAAVMLSQEALLLDLANAELVCELADTLLESGRVDEALRACELAVRMEPLGLTPRLQLARCRLRRSDPESALTALCEAKGLCASGHHIHADLSSMTLGSCADTRLTAEDAWRSAWDLAYADALRLSGNPGKALESSRAAADRLVDDAAATLRLAEDLDRLGQFEEAALAFTAAGVALSKAGRLTEAADTFSTALVRKAGSLRALLGLAEVQAQRGQFREASTCIMSALTIDARDARAVLDLGRVAYALGEQDRAWDAFMVLDSLEARERRSFEQPRWSGDALTGRTILAIADEALGDAIQSLRYLPFLRDAGGRIVLHCPERLVPIARRLSIVDVVVSTLVVPPAFDVYVPLSLVPAIRSELRRSIPPPMGLRPHRALVPLWRSRLERSLARQSGMEGSARLAVGLSWGGHPDGVNARLRFTRLEAFAPLAGIEGVDFVSLQMGLQTVDLLSPPAGLHVLHLQEDGCSLDDTAALMESLDLIITVDTGVAHLGASLGLPVWMVLPHVADWRWQDETERTPWYPSIRIFRQTSPGDWRDVFSRVRTALIANRAQLREHRLRDRRQNHIHHDSMA